MPDQIEKPMAEQVPDQIKKPVAEQVPDQIEKLYLEITSHCNLDCAMCTRKNWLNQGIGHMSMALVKKIIQELPQHPQIKTIFLGGIGEPLVHPNVHQIIRLFRQAGKQVELITNGTLLTKECSKNLLRAGLNKLWVSVDGAFSPCYEDIRRGVSGQDIFANLESLSLARRELGDFNLHIYDLDEYLQRQDFALGLAFVAMKRNIQELPRLIDQARRFGVKEIKVTHVIPYTKEMVGEALYDQVLRYSLGQLQNPLTMHLDLPLMDWNQDTIHPLAEIYNKNLTISNLGRHLLRQENHCPFVENNQCFVRWDGQICPCMALLHDNKQYLNGVERSLEAKSFGDCNRQALAAIWQGQEYTAFRGKVREFSFSPCVGCGECELLEANQEDCFGNNFPTCGGCLWAQSLVQCP